MHCERLALYKKACQISFTTLCNTSAELPSTASSAAFLFYHLCFVLHFCFKQSLILKLDGH